MREALLIFVSTFTALVVTEFYERIIKRPTFLIQSGDSVDGASHRFLHINVTNVERHGWRKLLRSNDSAELLKARISFIDPVTNSKICDFTGRWSSKVEPLEELDYVNGTGRFSPFLAKEAETEALLPGETSPLTIAVKFDEENYFYGFDNQSYARAWRTPKLKVTQTSVLVQFELFTTKYKKKTEFAILNPSNKTRGFDIKKKWL